MLFTAPVAANRRSAACHIIDDKTVPAWAQRLMQVRSEIPAVTHVDFSARVQTVDRVTNPALHAVLTAFANRTGCPVLVNTSFNVRGEPPVCHPREAIEGFLATDMDVLVLGPFFLEKRTLPATFVRSAQTRTFAPD